jgi:hypothetical protein
MYCIKLAGPKPDPEVFKNNAVGKDHVEKTRWAYFKATDVIFNEEGRLPNEYAELYSTFCIRLGLLREKSFLTYFVCR